MNGKCIDNKFYNIVLLWWWTPDKEKQIVILYMFKC